jgi:DNA mismatch endonuclease (patch repair protein)
VTPASRSSWASSPDSRRRMRANRARDTTPERQIRSALHRRGFRFFVDRWVIADGVRTRPDLLFPRRWLAVYVDGCFWHRCPEHATDPKTNSAYWGPKLAANVARDRRATVALETAGWTVLRFWEHENPHEVASSVETALGSA